MDLLFLSSDPISIDCLQALAGGQIPGVKVSGVITNPDRRSGRGKKLQQNVVAAQAEELGLPILQTPKLSADEIATLHSFDAALVFAFGQILPRSVLSLRPGLFLNIHASPLPQLRGPSPIETAIAEGWTQTEISLMRMVQRMDAGDIALRQTIPIGSDETGHGLRKIIAAQSALLLQQIQKVTSPHYQWEAQDEKQATWCRKITKADACLDFSHSAQTLVNQSRAFDVWPGSTVEIGGEMMKVTDIHKSTHSGQPGEVLSAGEQLIIAAGEDSVSIGKIQRPSRKMIPFAEFQRTSPIQPRTLLTYPCSVPFVRSHF